MPDDDHHDDDHVDHDDDVRTRLGLAVIGLALVIATTARAEMPGDPAKARVSREQLREQLRNSGNPSGSTCPARILADYGNRVAADEAAKQAHPKSAWAAGGKFDDR